MASQADTLKVAQADMDSVRTHLANARYAQRRSHRDLQPEVHTAVRLMERTARLVRKAFKLGED